MCGTLLHWLYSLEKHQTHKYSNVNVMRACYSTLKLHILVLKISVVSLHYLCSLEENGQTALGPALLLSVFLAAKVPGSRVSSI